ncbi:MAG: S49 family peptidase [Rhodothalassiaceae bacterium]
MAILDRLWSGGRPVVGVLRLSGPIGVTGRFRPGLSFASVAPLIHQVFGLAGLKAVALLINSPGGSPVQAALIMKRIRDLGREKDVPVIAFAEDIAASGGYMLALAADEIFAHEASIVGSIGVISASFGFPRAIEKLGIERRLHTAGESKARLDPFSPEKPEDVAWLLSLQAEIHEQFKAMVRERRGRRLKSEAPGLFSGDVWLGRRAAEMGLIDGIGDMRTVMRQRFGRRTRFRLVGRRRGLFANVLGGRSAFDSGAPEAGGGFAQDLLATLEARAMWQRFGL